MSFQNPRWQLLAGYRFGDVIAGSDEPAYVSSWSQVVVVRSGTSMEFYLNGRRQAQHSILRAITDLGYLLMGRHFIGANPIGAYPLVGSMDEVRFYNRSLSTGEVASLYAFEKYSGFALDGAATKSPFNPATAVN